MTIAQPTELQAQRAQLYRTIGVQVDSADLNVRATLIENQAAVQTVDELIVAVEIACTNYTVKPAELRTVEIDVTAARIEEGSPCSTRNCPIALALLAVLKPGYKVAVSPYSAAIYNSAATVDDRELFGVIFEQRVSDWINSYDATRPGQKQKREPISFHTVLPAIMLAEAEAAGDLTE